MPSGVTWRILALVSVATGWGIAAGCSSFAGDSAPNPSEEAGTDAPAAGDAGDGGARFCKTGAAATAIFCADFDDGPLDAGWQLPPYTRGGTLATTPSDRSPPNAMLATVDTFPPLPAADAGDAGDAGSDPSDLFGLAVLSTTLGRGVAQGASLELDIRIDELPTTEDGGASGGQLASLGFDPTNRQAVAFGFYKGLLSLTVSDPSLATGPTILPVALPSTSSWFHVKISCAFNGGSAALSFNGIQVASTPQGIDTDKVGIFLDIGAVAAATTGKARVAYDNVVLTLLP